jgi:hypothetical protein
VLSITFCVYLFLLPKRHIESLPARMCNHHTSVILGLLRVFSCNITVNIQLHLLSPAIVFRFLKTVRVGEYRDMSIWSVFCALLHQLYILVYFTYCTYKYHKNCMIQHVSCNEIHVFANNVELYWDFLGEKMKGSC